ncbi:MAG: hypothetical protein H0X13_07625 [Ramlibacter sp.]|nr:hypothetical protein [Ramlibacter sp.]
MSLFSVYVEGSSVAPHEVLAYLRVTHAASEPTQYLELFAAVDAKVDLNHFAIRSEVQR